MTREEEIKMQAEKKALEPSRLMHPYAKQYKVMSAYEIGYIEGAVWADAHPHWLSVEDELPKIGKDVLVLREDGEMQVAHQYNESIARWWSVDGFPLKNNITHWMPKPEVPHHFADVSQKVKKGGDQ